MTEQLQYTYQKSHSKKQQQRNNHYKTNKQNKRKSRVTREYQEVENEIRALLDDTHLSIGTPLDEENTNDDRSISLSCDFFWSADNESELKLTQRESNKTSLNSTAEELSRTVTIDPDDQSEIYNTRTQVASSFIPIDQEADTVPIIRTKNKLQLDENLLYSPTTQINWYVKRNLTEREPALDRRCSKSVIRMVNRYIMEDNTADTIASGCSLKNPYYSGQSDSFEKSKLYRTLCDHNFRPIFCKANAQTIDIPSRKLAKLYIRDLRFTEHPLMLEEHRLCNILEDMYAEYSSSVEEKICENIAAELKFERRVVSQLLQSEDGGLKMIAHRHVSDLEEHLHRVKVLRNKLYQQEMYNKHLLEQILDQWILLRNFRKSQHKCNTRFKLGIIMKEITEADSRQWAQRFETDLNEIYREELEVYYKEKRQCKNEADKKPKKKPKKPNIEKLRAQLKVNLGKCTRLPDEQKVEIIRTQIDEDVVKPLEKQRSYFLRIFFDRQYVGETRTFRLEPDLSLCINESIGIVLERRMPKELKLSLYEKTKIPTVTVKLAKMLVPLPLAVSNCNQSKQLITLNFSSNKQRISGRLTIGFQCDEDDEAQDDILKATFRDTSTTRTVAMKFKQMDEVASSDEGEKDVDDTFIKSESDVGHLNECTLEENLLQFCCIEEIENNPRFKLLSSRYRRLDARTKDLRFIPSLENELELELEDREERVIETGNWMDPIDFHKHCGKKHLRSVYEVIRNHCSHLQTISENPEDLLIGNEPVTFSTFFQTLASFFSPSRPLNPSRSSYLPPINGQRIFLTPTSANSGQLIQIFNIVVNVVRATGIPIRARTGLETLPMNKHYNSSSTSFLMSQNLKYSNVRPYVVVCYKDKCVRTMTAEGSNPTWNEQLVLQISGNLNEIRDDIKIELFDESIENQMADDDTARSMDVYQRIQSNWLGEYRIPVGTIFARQRIEGVFELDTPKVLLGYTPPSLEYPAVPVDTNVTVDQLPEIKETVHLWLYVSVEPAFQMLQINHTLLECSELKEVRNHLNEWCMQVKELQADRFLEPLVCNTDGKRICLTRLLEPIPLPIEVSENLVDSCCRFVSMLNILKNYDPCLGFSGIWLDNQALLDTTWGSPKDLGVLLANFFLTIGIPCWVVLGIAYPHGESAFILYRQDGLEYFLADPCSGKRYSSKDVFCPMTKIQFIFNQNNIYCNIQSESRVPLTNFNLSDTSCWFPVFSKRNPPPMGGVQKLNYVYRNSFNCTELRKNIERKIVKKINSWRSTRKTIWNRAFQTRMQNILVELEYNSTFSDNSNSRSSISHVEKFLSDFPNYKIYGFTLNFSYNNLASISERIKSTGIHLNSDKNVEFSVAVYLHSYPNNIFSVWIFLISIIPFLYR